MKIKTSELTDAALDWAVCIANGLKPEDIYINKWRTLPASLYRRNRDEDGNLDGTYTTGPGLLFSEKWEAGGPIIEREGVLIRPQPGKEAWDAWKHGADEPHYTVGPTPLIAAMRCYVTSKLGDTVDIPKELCK